MENGYGAPENGHLPKFKWAAHLRLVNILIIIHPELIDSIYNIVIEQLIIVRNVHFAAKMYY